jgi:hypothetical protein
MQHIQFRKEMNVQHLAKEFKCLGFVIDKTGLQKEN